MYEPFRSNENGQGGIRYVVQGEAVCEISDLSDNMERLENLAKLYNENHLLRENFFELTQKLVGVLI